MKDKIKILFVEDVPSDAELLFHEISKNEILFDRMVVETEKDYLAALTTFSPDIIISDYSLPTFNGLEALRLKETLAPEIPFILVTGSLNEETAVECMKAGADDYILKQNLKRLAPAIKSALKKIEIIASKKKIEAALKESEDIFNSFMEYSPIYIFFKDSDTRPIRLSRNFEKMLGMPMENILGKTMDELFPMNLAKSMTQDDLTIIKGGTPIKVIETLNDRIYETTKFPIKRADGTNYLAGFTMDITRQKQAEANLSRLVERFNLALKAAQFGVWDYEVKNNNLIWDNRIYEMFGLNSNDPDGNYEKWINLIHPDDRTEIVQLFQKTLNGGANFDAEYSIVLPDKSIRYIKTYGIVVYDNNNNPNRMTGINVDNTERFQTLEQLKVSKNRLNTIVNNLHGVVFQCLNDRNWTMKYINDGILELSGYPAEDFIDNNIRTFSSIIHPDDQGKGWNKIQDSIKENKYYTLEYRIITASGAVKWVWEKGHGVFENDQLVALEGFISDITERKKGEILIKKLSEAVEQSPSSTIITDSNGKIEFVNSQFTLLTHYSLDDVKGKKPRIFNQGHYPQEIYTSMMDTLQSGKTWKSEFVNRKKNGAKYWEDVIIAPLTDSDGQICNFILITDDITENKKMLFDLIKAKSMAEESNRLKTSFLQNISHEIRTPMNSIVGFAGILNSQDITPEKRKYYTGIIEQASNQLLSVITDIILIATLESGQEVIRNSETKVNQILRILFDQFELRARSNNISLTYKTLLTNSDSTILTDETKLIQILTNLIGNAIKFTKEGFIDFGYSLKDNFIEFYVKDSGIGIQKEMQDEIFERFRQADNTIAQNYGGTGLGLSISKAYVELMGGKIRVESQPGKGSQFYFNIPYKKFKSKSSALEHPELGNIRFDKSKTILVAEDEDFNYKLICELLSDFDIKLIRAFNGIEAIEICKSNEKIDLVIMDIKMPKMNGYEATKIIKEIRPDLNIIAQTAYSFDNDKAKALESGCSDYIAKPFSKHQFLMLLKNYLT